MPRKKFETVSEYRASLTAAKRKIFDLVWRVLQGQVPGASEVISYNIPALSVDGPVVYLAAFKNHLGLYPPVRDEKLRAELRPWSNAKGNLAFPFDAPMPVRLIAKVARTLNREKKNKV